MKPQLFPGMNRLCISMLFCAVFALISCENEDDVLVAPEEDGLPKCSNGYRLAKRGSWEFFYDQQDRLAKLIQHEANGEDFIYYYEYSVDEKPDKIKIMRLIGGQESQIREESIAYTAARHPVLLTDFYLDDSTVIFHHYTTDVQGRIVADSMRNAYYGIGVNTINWDGDNLARYVLNGFSETTYEFDDKSNPFYPIRYCFLETPESTFFWSKNNATHGTFKASIVEEELDLNISYYDNGLISGNTSGNYLYECR
jgi:hypothetical protein